jgi:hypothetical protein
MGRSDRYRTLTFSDLRPDVASGRSDGLQGKPNLLSYKVSRIFPSQEPFLLSDILCRSCLVPFHSRINILQ